MGINSQLSRHWDVEKEQDYILDCVEVLRTPLPLIVDIDKRALKERWLTPRSFLTRYLSVLKGRWWGFTGEGPLEEYEVKAVTQLCEFLLREENEFQARGSYVKIEDLRTRFYLTSGENSAESGGPKEGANDDK